MNTPAGFDDNLSPAPEEKRLIQWFPIGSGKLALFHRPGSSAFQKLLGLGCRRLVTLLSARENAMQVGTRALNAGMEWTWLPLQNGNPPAGETEHMLVRGLYRLTKQVQMGEAAVIHCSAGIHRTGMAAYTVLRLSGLSIDQSMDAIKILRNHTYEGLRLDHRQWGEQVVNDWTALGKEWMNQYQYRPFPQSYWVIPGKLMAGQYPGSVEAAESEQKLRGLVACGVNLVINLMEAQEVNHQGQPFAPYLESMQAIAANSARQVEWVRHPIRDMSTPDESQMKAILNEIDQAIEAGKTVYLHCWGGVGRTGTVIGCYLARHGISAGLQTLERIAELRRDVRPLRASPETDQQREMVRKWRAGE